MPTLRTSGRTPQEPGPVQNRLGSANGDLLLKGLPGLDLLRQGRGAHPWTPEGVGRGERRDSTWPGRVTSRFPGAPPPARSDRRTG
jgi:hypothetical protein